MRTNLGTYSVADPDLELRGGGGKAGFSSTALPAFLPYKILFFFFFFFLIQNKASGAGPPRPLL